MHSLSFKVLGDFNAGSRMNLPGRGSFCVPEMEVGAMRCFGGRRGFGRTCRIVACASERNGDGGGSQSQSASASRSRSFLSRSETYALLKQQLEVAAKSEVSLSLLFSFSHYHESRKSLCLLFKLIGAENSRV